jgi:hypothetical protein
MFTTETVVQRYSHRREYKSWQCLEKRYYLFGFEIWRKELDREEIPQHILIQYLTMGDWRGWESKFIDYLD